MFAAISLSGFLFSEVLYSSTARAPINMVMPRGRAETSVNASNICLAPRLCILVATNSFFLFVAHVGESHIARMIHLVACYFWTY